MAEAAKDTEVGGTGKSKELKVTPDDLLKYANFLKTLIPLVDQAKSEMDGVKIKAGNFKDGSDLGRLVGWDDAKGRAKAFAEDLAQLKAALVNLSDKLREAATHYSDVEGLNKHLAEKAKDMVAEVTALLPKNKSAA
ncbi:hypothetical protein ACWGI8_20925 [Streptomyces sp. NPDC054841]